MIYDMTYDMTYDMAHYMTHDMQTRPLLYSHAAGGGAGGGGGGGATTGMVSSEMKPFVARVRPALSSPRTAVGLSQVRHV